MIKTVNFEAVANWINRLKAKSHVKLSNMFNDATALRELLDKKKCLSYMDENSIFLLVPYHDRYYDLLFISTDADSLKETINHFLSSYDSSLKIRVSLIGKESYVEELSSIFKKCRFSLLKKMARTKHMGAKSVTLKSLNTSTTTPAKSSSKSALADSEFSACLATQEDKIGILSLFLEEFDYCGDSLPELDDIEDNIKKRQVIVIKNKQSDVIACHYFEIKNGIFYGLYDVVKKEYRKYFLLSYIEEFTAKLLANVSINRWYGWRDIENKRLMKFALLNNQIPDGVYIYNMTYEGDSKNT